MTDITDLIDALRAAVEECIGQEPEVAVAYSGGLDSSIINSLATEVASTSRYTCAVRESPDDRLVREMVNEQRIPPTVIVLSEPRLIAHVREAAYALNTTNPVQIAYSIPILAVLSSAKEWLILAGSAADELFGGYAKYMKEEDPTIQMGIDLEKALEEIEKLTEMASSKGKTIRFPFASRQVIDLASDIPLKRKIDGDGRKIILRQAAKQLGIEAHDRPKKAAQYSSGIMKEMERLARRDGLDIKSWVEDKVSSDHRTS
ncbi:MAG: hypothetical protein E4H25_06770 [Methanomassiliicoccus sp.]|nr:MAG: hypothetical protein E4H25_06770 [Methanomassiliicoccus sp.]